MSTIALLLISLATLIFVLTLTFEMILDFVVRSQGHSYHHVADEGTKAERGKVIRPRQSTWSKAEKTFGSRTPLSPRTCSAALESPRLVTESTVLLLFTNIIYYVIFV